MLVVLAQSMGQTTYQTYAVCGREILGSGNIDHFSLGLNTGAPRLAYQISQSLQGFCVELGDHKQNLTFVDSLIAPSCDDINCQLPIVISFARSAWVAQNRPFDESCPDTESAPDRVPTPTGNHTEFAVNRRSIVSATACPQDTPGYL